MSKEVDAQRAELSAYMSEGARQTRAPYDPAFLKGSDVYPQLAQVFEQSCAYCETSLDDDAYGHIHLHRPAGFAADADGQTHRLHYLWLAFEWQNMLPVCAFCERAKGNMFPLDGERGDLHASIAQLNVAERPLLIDPCLDDPSDHLSFSPTGWAEARSRRGDATIRLFDLNRQDLIRARLAVFGTLAEQMDNWPPFSGDGVANPKRVFFGPHAGAATLALFDWCKSAVPEAKEWQGHTALVDFLARVAPDERQNLVRAFNSGASTAQVSTMPIKPATTLRKAPKKQRSGKSASRPSRAVKLANLPLASNPIRSVRIRNFKALKDIEFQLPLKVDDPSLVPSMLILGENATGKSSVLEALALTLLGTQETAALDKLLGDEDIRPDAYLHREDFEDWTTVSSDPLTVDVTYASADAVSRFKGLPEATTFQGDQDTAKILLAYGPRRFFTNKPRRRFRAPAYRVRSLFDPMDVIANPVDWLNSLDDETFDAAARALREILMLDRSAMFARVDGRVIIETESGRTPLSEMSVGYKSVIAMAADIMREMFYHYDNLEYASAVVLIDEIETHLHPRWKMRIMGLLRRAFPRVQFIATTHDPLCLKGMYAGEVFVLQRSTDDQMIETLRDLPDPQGMRAEQILTSEFFGLGSTDPDTDAKLARYHNLTRKQNLSDAEQRELDQLRSALSDRMAVGDTIQDQIVAEALKKAAIDPIEPLAKIQGSSRNQMVSDLLSAFRSGSE